jgi:hypothetical protein
VPALRAAVIRDGDPYVAAEALRSIIAIEGAGTLKPWLEELAEHAGFLVASVAREGLAG